jgi:hypothetical protein
MRVRLLELRLIAVGLAGLWVAVAALLLVGYRPGGPADLLVGIAALVPLAVALAAVAWPPAARGRLAYRVIAGLGVATAIILLPSLGGVATQLLREGLQTLLPSLEAAYPWGLAILGTSLFAGLGIARRLRGPASGRPGRLGTAVVVGLGLAVVAGGAVAGAAIVNELALRDQPAAGSRYGPTDPTLVPPACTEPIAAGSTAIVTMRLDGRVDGGSLGLASLRGTRSGSDYRWLADVTTVREVGLAGAASIDERAWLRETGTRWVPVGPEAAARQALDLAVVEAVLAGPAPAAPEDLGLAYLEGARARRCRIAVDGTTFRAAFPQVRWFVGAADLATWRGSLDVWVFADGQLGRIEGRVEGPGYDLEEDAIGADLAVVLDATYRGEPVNIVPPTN